METAVLVWLFPTVAAFALYLLKRNIDELDRTLNEHRVEMGLLRVEIQNVKNEYLHKNDFKDFKAELRLMFEDLKSDIKNITGKNGV